MTDLDQAKTDSKITRRTVAKGAAWTLPVVSLAAAAPAHAASPPVPPDCSTCFSAGYAVLGQLATTWELGSVAGGVAFTLTAGLKNTCSNVAFAFVGLTGATMTFREGGSATVPLSPNAGAGVLGQTLTAFVGTGTLLPSGSYFGKTIDTVCFPIQITVTIGGKQSTCPKTTLCWKLNNLGLLTPKISLVNFGVGPAVPQ